MIKEEVIIFQINNNIVECAKDTKLTILVEGAGSLAGFGNANPITEEIYTDNVHSTFYG